MIKSYKTRFQKFSALLSDPEIAKYARQNENYAFISCFYFMLLFYPIYNSNTITNLTALQITPVHLFFVFSA